jgi:hypothetical protein
MRRPFAIGWSAMAPRGADLLHLPWAVSVVGGDVVASEVAPLALERGGHLHLGLEFYGGDRTPKNVDLVEEAVALCGETEGEDQGGASHARKMQPWASCAN